MNRYRAEFRFMDLQAMDMTSQEHQALITDVARMISDYGRVDKGAGFRLQGGAKSVVVTFDSDTDPRVNIANLHRRLSRGRICHYNLAQIHADYSHDMLVEQGA